ncbi:hypothetical protein D3C83_13240 [compost metagenome]
MKSTGGATFEKLDGLQHLHRLDLEHHATAARRIKAVTLDARGHPGTEARELRQERRLEKSERGCAGVVGAALDHDARRRVRGDQRGQDGLEHEAGAARSTDVEMVNAGMHAAGLELERARADRVTDHVSGTDASCGGDGHRVLRAESGLVATRTDVLDAHGSARDERQSESGA